MKTTIETINTVRFVLDPTSEQNPSQRQILARPSSLKGLTVGLLDISKARGDVFLDQLERRLVGVGATVMNDQPWAVIVVRLRRPKPFVNRRCAVAAAPYSEVL